MRNTPHSTPMVYIKRYPIIHGGNITIEQHVLGIDRERAAMRIHAIELKKTETKLPETTLADRFESDL